MCLEDSRNQHEVSGRLDYRLTYGPHNGPERRGIFGTVTIIFAPMFALLSSTSGHSLR